MTHTFNPALESQKQKPLYGANEVHIESSRPARNIERDPITK